MTASGPAEKSYQQLVAGRPWGAPLVSRRARRFLALLTLGLLSALVVHETDETAWPDWLCGETLDVCEAVP